MKISLIMIIIWSNSIEAYFRMVNEENNQLID